MFFLYLSLFSLCVATIRDQNRGFFLQLTDIHIDLGYEVGSPANCAMGEQIGIGCCRSWSKPKNATHPELANIWGSHHCDLSPHFWNKTLGWIRSELMSKFPLDFVTLTGDIVDHHDITQTPEKNLATIKKVSSDLRRTFGNKVLIFPVLGNHDTYPVDQLAPPPFNFWLTPELVEWWGDWLIEAGFSLDSLETLLKGGYWTGLINFDRFESRTHPAKHRLIGINSLYWDRNNLMRDTDGNSAKQWTWLKATLNQSYLRGEKVWILGHIFPKTSEATDWFNQNYRELIANYSQLGVVQAQFFGHTHCDSFFLIGNQSQGFITPSLTPFNRNPSLRVYEYNRTTGEIIDYYQYRANLTQLIIDSRRNNTNPKLKFNLEYVLSQYYPDYFLDGSNGGVASAKNWYRFWQNLATDAHLFEKWYHEFTTGYKQGFGPCSFGNPCQKSILNEIMV